MNGRRGNERRRWMKGLFIPDITSEMFRNGCLESIEALMAEGQIYDMEYEVCSEYIIAWIPLPEPYKEGDNVEKND